MNTTTHSELAAFIWKICNLLRGPYKRNEYRQVILPLTVLRRFDCVLADTKQAVIDAAGKYAHQPDALRQQILETASGCPFYNTSDFDFGRLLNEPNLLAENLTAYIAGFSANVQEIIERFGFGDHITRLDEKNLLYEVIKSFAAVDLTERRVDNMQMGYIFEELIRVGAEQSNEEAGEHFRECPECNEFDGARLRVLLAELDDELTRGSQRTVSHRLLWAAQPLLSRKSFSWGPTSSWRQRA